MKKFLHESWLKTRKWLVALLIALGLMSPILYAEIVGFSYQAATEYEDGTPLPIVDIAFTRLYCDDVLVSEEEGADQSFSVDLGIGTHECYATHVVLGPTGDEIESDPSNTVIKVVNPVKPNAPQNLTLEP